MVDVQCIMYMYMYMYVISVAIRYYGRKCLSHFVTAVEFEKTAMRTLNNQQWVKLRDAVETLRVKVR